MKLLLLVLSIFTMSAYSNCLVTANQTITSGSAYNTCQAINQSNICNANPSCTWNPAQYYKNYCSGTSYQLTSCPSGMTQVAFSSFALPNPKFVCCRKVCHTGDSSCGSKPVKGNASRKKRISRERRK